MKRLHEVLSEMTKTFDDHGLLNPRRQAEELLCDALNCHRSDLYTNIERSLSSSECITCQLWLQRRLKGEPLAYISKKIHFYGCSLEINPHVLIPRQETEILVDKIVSALKKQDLKNKVLWDVCCGSGCIGIALKKVFPELTVLLSDCSSEAIDLAKLNAARNKVQVECRNGDLLTPFKGMKAHFIVCNPPYISEEEYTSLEKEVKEYEPRLALVGGKTGLEIYERLIKELPNYLYPKGQVWLEIGYQQGDALKKLVSGFWNKYKLENDWAGHDRFFFLENE